jgi:hypothetical protein
VITLDIDSKPQVTVNHYYNFLDYLIDIGGYMMILKFFIAIIGAYSLYGSYSTYISRKIRKEMIARNHQAKVDMHNNRDSEAATDPENFIMDVPTVFEIERKFNERVSSQAIYDMHDRLDRLESRKYKLGELEKKIGSIELA